VCGMEIKQEAAIVIEWAGQKVYFCSEGCRDRFLSKRARRQLAGSYDLIIVGGGPAGLTAATFAATLKLKVFLVSRDLGGQAVDSTRIENYMGFDFITGPELIGRFRQQLIQTHYIDHLIDGVEMLAPVTGGFRVVTAGGGSYTCRTVILATGMTRRKLGVPGEETFQRRGIFYGQIPDYSFVQGEDVAVVGGGNSALQIVETLQTVAKQVYVVSHGKLTADPTVVERILGRDNLSCHEGYDTLAVTGAKALAGIRIRHRQTGQTLSLAVRGVFIAIGQQPNSALVADLTELNEGGEVRIGPDCSTSCPGLFAAGDVTDVFAKRIIIASGAGAQAAIAVRQYLLKLDRRPAVAHPGEA